MNSIDNKYSENLIKQWVFVDLIIFKDLMISDWTFFDYILFLLSDDNYRGVKDIGIEQRILDYGNNSQYYGFDIRYTCHNSSFQYWRVYQDIKNAVILGESKCEEAYKLNCIKLVKKLRQKTWLKS